MSSIPPPMSTPPPMPTSPMPLSYASMRTPGGNQSFADVMEWRLVSQGSWAAAMLLLWLVVVGIIATKVRAQSLGTVLGQMGPMLTILCAVPTILLARGKFDLSVTGTAVLSGVIAAKIGNSSGMATGVLIGLIVGTVIGVINGALIAGAGFNSVLVTLPMAIVARQATVFIAPEQSIIIQLPGSTGMASAAPIWIGALMVAGGAFVLGEFAGFARPGNESGQPASANRLHDLILYALSGACAAIAACFSLFYYRVVSSSSFSGWDFQILVAIVAGGTCFGRGIANVIGALFAAMLEGALIALCYVLRINTSASAILLCPMLLVFLGLSELYRWLVQKRFEQRQ